MIKFDVDKNEILFESAAFEWLLCRPNGSIPIYETAAGNNAVNCSTTFTTKFKMDSISTMLLLDWKISPDILVMVLLIGLGFLGGMLFSDLWYMLFEEPDIPHTITSIPDKTEPPLLDSCKEKPASDEIARILEEYESEKLQLQAALRAWQNGAVEKAMEELKHEESLSEGTSFDQKQESDVSANPNYCDNVNKDLTKANEELEGLIAIRKDLEREVQQLKDLLQEEKQKAEKVTNICESPVAMQNDKVELATLPEVPQEQTDVRSTNPASDMDDKAVVNTLDEAGELDTIQLEVQAEAETTTDSAVTELDQNERKGYQAQIKQLEQERDAALLDAQTMRSEYMAVVEKGNLTLREAMKQADKEFAKQDAVIDKLKLDAQLAAEQSKNTDNKVEEYEIIVENLQKDLKVSNDYARFLASALKSNKGFWTRNGFLRPKKPKPEPQSKEDRPKTTFFSIFSRSKSQKAKSEIKEKSGSNSSAPSETTSATVICN